jgi:uncharacterized protein (TIGR03000 family)
MGRHRNVFGTWVLAAAVTLLAPAALPAQVFFRGPFSGNRGFFMPGFGFPGGMGYYNPYFGSGLYGSSMYFNNYMFTNPWVSVPTYQPITTGLLPLSAWPGALGTGPGALGTGAVYGSGAPRMREGWSPFAAMPAGYGGGAAGGYQGPYGQGGPGIPSYTPISCVSLTGGFLNFAPVVYAPASSASAAAVSVGPPPRMRVSYYNDGIRPADLSGSGADTEWRRAEVTVLLPRADAEVRFDGVKMNKKGMSRRFFTPRLDPGSRYTYDVQVRWRDNGVPREEVREIYLRAGDAVHVDFSGTGTKR